MRTNVSACNLFIACSFCISFWAWAVWRISWTWTYIQGFEHVKQTLVQKMMVNHIYIFFHFQSKIISNFQLDRKNSQMTSNFWKSFPSLHIQSVEKSVEYCHRQRCTICDSFSTCTVLSHVDQCLNNEHSIICSKVFECFNQNEEKKKIENYVFRATIDIELLNILLFIFFSHGFFLCFVWVFLPFHNPIWHCRR